MTLDKWDDDQWYGCSPKCPPHANVNGRFQFKLECETAGGGWTDNNQIQKETCHAMASMTTEPGQ